MHRLSSQLYVLLSVVLLVGCKTSEPTAKQEHIRPIKADPSPPRLSLTGKGSGPSVEVTALSRGDNAPLIIGLADTVRLTATARDDESAVRAVAVAGRIEMTCAAQSGVGDSRSYDFFREEDLQRYASPDSLLLVQLAADLTIPLSSLAADCAPGSAPKRISGVFQATSTNFADSSRTTGELRLLTRPRPPLPVAVDSLQSQVAALTKQVKTLSEKVNPTPNPNAPTYTVSIGASFDFVNRFRAADIYGSATLLLPKITEALELLGLELGSWGVEGGFYSHRTSPVLDTLETNFDTTVPVPLSSPDGTANLVEYAVDRRVERYRDDLGVFFTLLKPQRRPFFWALPHVEVRERESVVRVSDTVISEDPILASEEYLEAVRASQSQNPSRIYQNLFARVNDPPRRRIVPDYQLLIGGGFYIYHDDKAIDLRIRPLFGTFTSFRQPGRGTFLTTRFDLSVKAAKVSAGGEWRILNYGWLWEPRFREAEFLFYVAKQFDLGKFAEFVGS